MLQRTCLPWGLLHCSPPTNGDSAGPRERGLWDPSRLCSETLGFSAQTALSPPWVPASPLAQVWDPEVAPRVNAPRVCTPGPAQEAAEGWLLQWGESLSLWLNKPPAPAVL